MKKRSIFALLLALAIMLSLAACGAPSTTTNEPQTTTETVTTVTETTSETASTETNKTEEPAEPAKEETRIVIDMMGRLLRIS